MATAINDDTRLPKAVVIPRRRPSDRARGFVRAYAPDLLRCGIDQATFLQFIDGLNKSVAANPAVEAVDLAGEAVGAIPGGEFAGAPILGAALQVAAGAYKEVNARWGQNGYLTKMNDELFRPRGLYCLIMSYDVKSRRNVALPGQSDSSSHIIRDGILKSNRMRNHDGLLGASNFPDIADLIYPEPVELPGIVGEEEGSGKTSGNSAVWASGQSKLKEKMAARAEKEDLKSQVKFEKREAELQKKEEKREREAQKRARKYPNKGPRVHKPKEGILYIMVVNLP
ncbi:hypothetical protein DHEL01_v207433 [Diaporthe helianthi]|uniref:Uncharacterized protein n=1 Tax=Diaporthe helianthi TaxID=158607 RepID=A0A2P5HV90_DIAHE|nr:hypothetical protein DHEL01_v207433 [Diaporthe helianthi]